MREVFIPYADNDLENNLFFVLVLLDKAGWDDKVDCQFPYRSFYLEYIIFEHELISEIKKYHYYSS